MKLRILAAVLALTGYAATAEAAGIVGSDAFITFDVMPVPPEDLLSLAADGGSLNLHFNFFGTGTLGFTKIPSGTPIGDTSVNLGKLGGFGFTSSDGTFSAVPSMVIGGTTYKSAIVGQTGSAASGSETLSLYEVGNFTPSGSASSLDPNTMNITMSFTETAAGAITPANLGSFSLSATMASPAAPPSPPVNTPEPASLMMLGAGLLGLGIARRRS